MSWPINGRERDKVWNPKEEFIILISFHIKVFNGTCELGLKCFKILISIIIFIEIVYAISDNENMW